MYQFKKLVCYVNRVVRKHRGFLIRLKYADLPNLFRLTAAGREYAIAIEIILETLKRVQGGRDAYEQIRL